MELCETIDKIGKILFISYYNNYVLQEISSIFSASQW